MLKEKSIEIQNFLKGIQYQGININNLTLEEFIISFINELTKRDILYLPLFSFSRIAIRKGKRIFKILELDLFIQQLERSFSQEELIDIIQEIDKEQKQILAFPEILLQQTQLMVNNYEVLQEELKSFLKSQLMEELKSLIKIQRKQFDEIDNKIYQNLILIYLRNKCKVPSLPQQYLVIYFDQTPYKVNILPYVMKYANQIQIPVPEFLIGMKLEIQEKSRSIKIHFNPNMDLINILYQYEDINKYLYKLDNDEEFNKQDRLNSSKLIYILWRQLQICIENQYKIQDRIVVIIYRKDVQELIKEFERIGKDEEFNQENPFIKRIIDQFCDLQINIPQFEKKTTNQKLIKNYNYEEQNKQIKKARKSNRKIEQYID